MPEVVVARDQSNIMVDARLRNQRIRNLGA
jgi:hypothetical protein